ncbi:hypothetical protein [Hymenobacter rigui]|uniref:DUF4369 domain-containing protein n=1 Tax=Hymenobacter rigui TaxID=334424 RepID=A0A3R9V878_9BACT|nr:hypothetical protein [Hymenobacter rigui]RSK48746.1 hypothetical protein EI291_09245 [Hymenobacter rigui]
MKTLLLVLLTICGLGTPAIAQKKDKTGSFLLVNGTTGKGEITYNLATFFSRAKLVVKDESGKNKYPIHEVQSFNIDGQSFIRVDNIPFANRAIYDRREHNDPVFLEILELAEIEIYRYGYVYQSGNTVSYLNTPVFRKKGTDKYIVYTSKKTFGFNKNTSSTEELLALFPNSPDIQALLQNKKTELEAIASRIHQYNITGK